jgi:hypothetical protein
MRVYNPIQFHRGKPTATMPSRRTVAVEIEVSDMNFSRKDDVLAVVNRWSASVKGDSSIDSENGFELTTAPASGTLFEAQIGEICRELNAANAEVTAKCGLHVHVGTYDYSYEDYLKLHNLWMLVQDHAFAIMPPSRRHNSYCARNTGASVVPAGPLTTAQARDALLVALNGGGWEKPERWYYSGYPKSEREYHRKMQKWDTYTQTLKIPYVPDSASEGMKLKRSANHSGSQPGVGSRYRALNILSAFNHGTVEFRLHSGTTDETKIRNWASWCAALVDYAKLLTMDEIVRFPSEKASGWAAFRYFAGSGEQKDYFEQRRRRFEGV